MQSIFHITYHCHFESSQAHRGVVWPHRDVRAQSARPQQRSQGGVLLSYKLPKSLSVKMTIKSKWSTTLSSNGPTSSPSNGRTSPHHRQRSHPHRDHSRCGLPSPGWQTKRTLEASVTSSRVLARWTSWTTWQCIYDLRLILHVK